MAFAANLSVVTYTFNDASLARGLLASLAGQTVSPREIIAVDDGSREPFAPPPTAPETRLIRLDPNRGATRAKQAGLDATTSKFILSVDADVRLDPGWTAEALALAARQEIGLVSSRIAYASGEDPVSRYMALVYGFDPAPGETDYVPGPVWMIRREVWREVGGFKDYHEPIGEDSYLCARLREKGYGLRIIEVASARQVRRLTRTAMVKRGFSWQGSSLHRELDKGTPPPEVLRVFACSVAKRLEGLLAIAPDLAYFELLYLGHGLLDLAGRIDPALARGLRAGLAELAAGWSGVSALLAADLDRLGHPRPEPGVDPASGAALIAPVAAILDQPVLRRIEESLPAIAAEKDKDFSFYVK